MLQTQLIWKTCSSSRYWGCTVELDSGRSGSSRARRPLRDSYCLVTAKKRLTCECRWVVNPPLREYSRPDVAVWLTPSLTTLKCLSWQDVALFFGVWLEPNTAARYGICFYDIHHWWRSADNNLGIARTLQSPPPLDTTLVCVSIPARSPLHLWAATDDSWRPGVAYTEQQCKAILNKQIL